MSRSKGQLTKSQVDQIGDRLRSQGVTEADERMLDQYRELFAKPATRVMRALEEQAGLKPTARSTKTVQAIVEKLRRETIRLSQMQDIAGCRVVVDDIVEQDRVVQRILKLFDECRLDDLRLRPSHGYRAVHIIVRIGGLPIEVQVRTRLQDVWAQLSEVLSDKVERSLKYGGGPQHLRESLRIASDEVGRIEAGADEVLDEVREVLRQDLMEHLTRSKKEWQEQDQ